MEEHQAVLARVLGRHADCREELAEMRGYAGLLRGRMQQILDATGLGAKFGPLPDPPAPKPRPAEDAAFLGRQVAQDVELIKGADERLNAPPKDPGGAGT